MDNTCMFPTMSCGLVSLASTHAYPMFGHAGDYHSDPAVMLEIFSSDPLVTTARSELGKKIICLIESHVLDETGLQTKPK